MVTLCYNVSDLISNGGETMRLNLPDIPKLIIKTLEKNGFECYAVGGCVRDSIIGHVVNDWDFTTNATPSEIEHCFSDYTTVDIGKKFGTICVVIDGENFEITTYRTDGDYSDSRHPESVEFSQNLLDDLSRRDFTINALAYNDRVGLVDEFDSLNDLRFGVIRCIGDADTRFNEDALRILRALRFASTYGYSIESKTSEAILTNKDKLNHISSERVIKEFSRLLCGDNVDFILRRYRDVIAIIIPEVSVMFNFNQNSLHHNKDLWRHTVSSVKHTAPDEVLRTAMLLHDIGKPMTVSTDKMGHSHFHNHPKLSAAMASTILKRLKYPTAFINKVNLLIENHDIRLTPDTPTVKRCMRDLGADNTKDLLTIQRADILAQSTYKRQEKLYTLDLVVSEYERILNSGECYTLDALAVNGKDIIHLGVSSGELIGKILSKLLDKVIEGKISNDTESLLLYAKNLIKS